MFGNARERLLRLLDPRQQVNLDRPEDASRIKLERPAGDIVVRIQDHLRAGGFNPEGSESERQLLYESGIHLRKWLGDNGEPLVTYNGDNWTYKVFQLKDGPVIYSTFGDFPPEDDGKDTFPKIKFAISLLDNRTDRMMSLMVKGNNDYDIHVNYGGNKEDVYFREGKYSTINSEDTRLSLHAMVGILSSARVRNSVSILNSTMFDWHKRVRQLYRSNNE